MTLTTLLQREGTLSSRLFWVIIELYISIKKQLVTQCLADSLLKVRKGTLPSRIFWVINELYLSIKKQLEVQCLEDSLLKVR